ncbi:murein hydrolase activator EnvC family protein [Frateuria aurantia]|nr:peptidoglycan DD-metalloendopeptidase family protein [Frateuria aurantia]
MPIRFRSAPLACLLLGSMLTAPASAQSTRSQQAQARKQLHELHQQVQDLTEAREATRSQQQSVTAALARQAQAVAMAARSVRQTEQALGAKQQELDTLLQQRDALKLQLQQQRQAIGELLRAAYSLGQGSDLRLLLGDDDVGRIARALMYSHYFQQDRQRRVAALMGQLAQLQQLEGQIRDQQQLLQQTRQLRSRQQQQLARQRAAQQKLLDQTNARYQTQGQKLAALRQDEASLNQMLARLQRALDEAARAAARESRQNPSAPTSRGNIRGNLPWPAKGAVRRHGNGVLIAAAQGSEIHAVARGRVVFIGFLRGYGTLIILNHGDGWTSGYGNTETQLCKVGDQIEAGQTLATASAATDNDNSGVYFELRHRLTPTNPEAWLSAHR